MKMKLRIRSVAIECFEDGGVRLSSTYIGSAAIIAIGRLAGGPIGEFFAICAIVFGALGGSLDLADM